MGLQSVGHNWATKLNWTELEEKEMRYQYTFKGRDWSSEGEWKEFERLQLLLEKKKT